MSEAYEEKLNELAIVQREVSKLRHQKPDELRKTWLAKQNAKIDQLMVGTFMTNALSSGRKLTFTDLLPVVLP